MGVADRTKPIPTGQAREEDRLSDQNSQSGVNDFRKSPTGPPVVAPRIPLHQPPPPPLPAQAPRRKRNVWSIAIFVLLVSGVVIRAYQDLSQPDAWDYWKDQYISPSMTFSAIANADLDGAGKGRRALFVSGTIGPAAAKSFRDRLDEAKLAPGDIDPAVLARRRFEPGHDHGRDHPIARPGDGGRHPRCLRPRQARLLRQRLRARLCRRQDPVRRAGLGARAFIGLSQPGP